MAPRKDMQFLLHDWLNVENLYRHLRGNDDVNRDLIDAILEEGAKFAENEIAPLNQSGDVGCVFDKGEVKTPKGFKEAYIKYVEGGWPSLPADESLGGQGLPNSIAVVISEIIGAANWSWSMYPGLSHGAIHTLTAHGTEDQKAKFLTKLVSGEWTGTMCLTESHCGSDLGTLRSKAEPNSDGSYNITGTKIFISAGEHDLTENIVHIVLARLPGAPQGTKGISLFIVPKYLPAADGSVGARNGVACGSIEHKMGINGSATCVINFDNAKGFLLGEPNRGLNSMFVFMNAARIGTALQGICHAEASFQGALEYARDRTAMRSLSGPKFPEKEADSIIVHPDVRRMLLTQKVFAEGGRGLCYYLGTLTDFEHSVLPAEEKAEAEELMAFLTPIAKAFLTEVGYEAANHGVQIYGGHGYIREWGMEQIVRDARIATIYEGTTGIQALDLLGRKVLMTQGKLLRLFTKKIHVFCKENAHNSAVKSLVNALSAANKEWGDVTTRIGMLAMKEREEVGGAAYDYVMYSGYVTLAFIWAQLAVVAHKKLALNDGDADFYRSKIAAAQFYFQKILPRTQMHKACIESGVESLMTLSEDQFGFY
ncbi:MAG: acyl-CoA dehydrogenase C-terminal domain-containing protein [Pseudomonadota bacterium]